MKRTIRAAIANLLKLKVDRSGATLLEFALVFTTLIALIFGTILWGLWLWELNTIQYATLQAARCSVLPVPPGGARLCDPSPTAGYIGASYGVLNAYAMKATTTEFPSQLGLPTTSASAGVGQYYCVSANHASGLASLAKTPFRYQDRNVKATVCYTSP